MEIPNSQACMVPLLKFAADGRQHSLQEATDALADHFQLPPEKRMQLRESGVNKLYNTVGWAKTFLKQAELLDYPERGMLQITEKGKKVLESGVQYIDFKYLERFPSFVEFQNRKGTRSASGASSEPYSDGLDELMQPSLLKEKQIWVFAPGPQARFWNDCRSGSIAVFGTDLLGPLDAYGTKDEIQQRLKVVYPKDTDTEPSNDALAAWEFSRVMKEGDLVIAKKGNHKIVGVGVVSGPYRHDPSRLEYPNIRDIGWTHEGEWLLPDGVRFATKTLTNITRYRDYVDTVLGVVGIKIKDISEMASVEHVDVLVINDENEPDMQPEYSITDCSHETGLDEETLIRWVRAIERKNQAILYGPPGTGKTYVARRLAKHLAAGSDGFIELVQFHPTYAYEDFIQGIRPMTEEDGGLSYPLVPGRFLEFCKKAEQRKGPCVLILDEINRANLSRVFGELMYLLEYRDHSIPLAGGERFGIPKNVRLIGTMNTADRSIALVDHALRRRFAFLELYPNYEVLERFHSDNEFPVTGLLETLKSVNRQIGDRHYMVGISFFLRNDLVDQIEDIWRMEIEPYLEEYFFDQPAKVDEYRWAKVKVAVAIT